MNILFRLCLIALLFVSAMARAQGPYIISGKVADEKGNAAAGATVFISGTQQITTTNNDGKFVFNSIDAGTYQISVKLLGYYPYTVNVIVQLMSVSVDLTLIVKPIILNTVKIGGDGNWNKNFKIFADQFLGNTINGKQCQIINPDVISFGSVNKKLTAEADEFLIIENKRLGYRIRYLLKAFEFNPTSGIASYDGDTVFEPLEGTDVDKAGWAANRLEVYNGSLMHFLRSVFRKTVSEEGFRVNQLYTLNNAYGKATYADPRPVKFDTIVTVIDTALVSAKFTSLYVFHNNTKKDSNAIVEKADKEANRFTMSKEGSILKLFLEKAIIDRRGSYSDYRTFLRQGAWGRRRVGDELPFEYEPDK